MPDARTPDQLPPGDWRGALSALPLETPPADGWDAIAARIPNRQHRWPIWLAVAATLALAVGLPLRWTTQQGGAPPLATSKVSAQAIPATSDPHQDAAAQTTVAAINTPESDPTAQPDTVAKSTAPPAKSSLVATRPEESRLAVNLERDPPAARPAAATLAVADPGATAVAASATVPATRSVDAASTSARAELDQLQAESAGLEALLALTRDERVSSASAAILGDGFDAQVSSIDAALMQPSLSDRQRSGLWRERVTALRQLVGFESTQRVLAAYGQRDDARLASVD